MICKEDMGKQKIRQQVGNISEREGRQEGKEGKQKGRCQSHQPIITGKLIPLASLAHHLEGL